MAPDDDVWAADGASSLLSLAVSSGVAPLSFPLPGEPQRRFSAEGAADVAPGPQRDSLSHAASSAQLGPAACDGGRTSRACGGETCALLDGGGSTARAGRVEADASRGAEPVRGGPGSAPLRRASVSLPDLTRGGDLWAEAPTGAEGWPAESAASAHPREGKAAAKTGGRPASALDAYCAGASEQLSHRAAHGSAGAKPAEGSAAVSGAAPAGSAAVSGAASTCPASPSASPPVFAPTVPSIASPPRRSALSRFRRASARAAPATEAPVGTSPDDLEVYVSFRFFRENAEFLTKRAPPGFAEALRDAGICHYTAIVRDPRTGALVEFDFGPDGGRDVEFVNPKAKAIWKRLRAGGRGRSRARDAAEARDAAAQDALFVSRDLEARAGGSGAEASRATEAAEAAGPAGRARTVTLQRPENVLSTAAASASPAVAASPASSASAAPASPAVAASPASSASSASAATASTASSSTSSARASPEAAPRGGKVRETLLESLPPQCAFVGRTRLSLEEIRAFTRAAAVDRPYRLHVSDCRHFADELVLTSTGVPGACARTVAAHWPAVRERYGPAGSIVRAGHLFTNHENWVYVRAAGRAGALAAALGAGRRALAAVSSLSAAAAARGRLGLLARSVVSTSLLSVLSARNHLLQNGLCASVAEALRARALRGGVSALRARLLRDPAAASGAVAASLAASGQAAGPRATAALGVSRAAEAAGGLVAAASGRPRAVGAALAAAVAATAAARGRRELVAARGRALERGVRAGRARAGESAGEPGAGALPSGGGGASAGAGQGALLGTPLADGRLCSSSDDARVRASARAARDGADESDPAAGLPDSLSSRVTSALRLLPFRRRAGPAGRKGRPVVVLRRNSGKQGSGRAADAGAAGGGRGVAALRAPPALGRGRDGSAFDSDGPPPALPAAISRGARRRALEALGGARARAVSAVRRAGEAARRPEERRGLLAVGVGSLAAIAAKLGEAAARGRN